MIVPSSSTPSNTLVVVNVIVDRLPVFQRMWAIPRVVPYEQLATPRPVAVNLPDSVLPPSLQRQSLAVPVIV